MWQLLSFPNIITVSCVLSIFLSSTRNSVFWPVLSGCIIGSIISAISPISIHLYIAIVILLVTVTGMPAKITRYIPDHRDLSIPSIILSLSRVDIFNDILNNVFYANRISYTAHNMLENAGPTLVIEDPLTPDNIMIALNIVNDFRVIQEMDNIRKTLEKGEFLHQVSGVFIHTFDTGLVVVRGPNTTNQHIMSIRI